MKFIKGLFKNVPTRIWIIVTVAVLILAIGINITLSFLSSTMENVLDSRPRPIVVERGLEKTKEAVLADGYKVSEEIAEEGFVLLKNDGNILPLSASEKKISVFGKNSINLVYGASGSGGKNNLEGTKTIFDSLTAAGISYNPTLKSFYENNSASGSGRTSSPPIENGGVSDLNTGETAMASYTEAVKSSYSEYKDAALIVLSRIGGEGWDLPRTKGHTSSWNSENDHYLQLDRNEKDLLKAVCNEGFTKVIVVINSNNPIELGFLDDNNHYAYDSRIKGCLWIGTPGDTGIMALGRILSGDVSPSGRTVDTYARNFTDSPVWVNFGDMNVRNGEKYLYGTNQVGVSYTFVDYEEDIYVGYRYYETRAFEEEKAGNTTWYNDNVVYPFGYGKSYATFEQSFSQKPANLNLTDGDAFNVKVKVTNTSSTYTKSAKDAVQVYVTAPYSSTAKVEKSHVVLAAFDKTEAIAPGSGNGKEVDIKIDPYLFASYDEKTDGGCFVLEAGNYIFRLGKSAHEFYSDSFTMTVATTIKFKDGVKDEVKNRFQDAADPTQLQSTLSRSDFGGTMPEARTDAQKQMNSDLKTNLDDRKSTNPIVGSSPEYPDTDIESNLVLRDMFMVDYDDELWDTFIKMLTIKEMTRLVTDGQFKTEAINRDRVIVPATICTDGPFGFVNFISKTDYGKVYYPSEVVIASTWNPDLAKSFGESVGEEALIGNGDIPITGWYAPGVNIHRSPFGGRASEYFSEDTLMSGKMAAGVVAGARSKGLITFVKHFAVNEQETSRQGIATWLTEQALREIYLRPFELTVKEGNTLAMMSSFNRIGTKWTGGDYRLLTEVLRDEWGFEGMVVCDYFVSADFANSKQMIYAGGDLHLMFSGWFSPSNSSAEDITILQTASKNILFALANSNISGLKISGYLMAYWVIWTIVINAVVLAALLAWGALVIILYIRGKRETT